MGAFWKLRRFMGRSGMQADLAGTGHAGGAQPRRTGDRMSPDTPDRGALIDQAAAETRDLAPAIATLHTALTNNGMTPTTAAITTGIFWAHILTSPGGGA